MALSKAQQTQFDSLTAAGASKDAAMNAAMLVPDTSGAGAKVSANSTDPFIQQLQQKLLGQSDIISSTNTKLEDKIGAAIKGVQDSTGSANAATTLAFDREKGYAADAGATKLTGAQEGQRGFAQNTAALKQLTDSTQKQLNDLESRKQELILQNNAQAAQQVSSLQLQAIKFQQEAQQQVFSNLLGMGNFAQQQAQMKQQADQFSRQQGFAENQAVSQVALKYGLTVGPGETLESITTKAMPLASQEEQLQLAQFRSQIAANNASTQKAYADIRANQPLDAATLASLGSAMLSNPNMVMSVVKNSDQLGAILGAAKDAAYKDAPSNIQTNVNNGVTLETTKTQILGSPYLSVDQKKTLIDNAETAYATGNVPSTLGTQFGKGLPQGAAALGAGYNDLFYNVLGWATGVGADKIRP